MEDVICCMTSQVRLNYCQLCFRCRNQPFSAVRASRDMTQKCMLSYCSTRRLYCPILHTVLPLHKSHPLCQVLGVFQTCPRNSDVRVHKLSTEASATVSKCGRSVRLSETISYNFLSPQTCSYCRSQYQLSVWRN